jgi:tRNA 2-thiouridine synthesizing protein A
MPEELVVDARGLLCPIPVLRLERALRRSAPGTVAVLLATDPAAEADVETLCRERGHALLSCEREGPLMRMRVRRA